MADGNLLTADYQFQLHDTLYGTGNGGVSIESGQNVEGLGVPDAKTQDVAYNFTDGSYANPDYLAMRLITIPVIVRGATVAAVMTSVKNLMGVWVPKTADTDLSFQLPGWGKFEVHGRPRGAKLDLTLMNRRVVRALLRFDCPSPTISFI